MTELVYLKTTQISEYRICNGVPDIDLSRCGTYNVGTVSQPFLVEVFDSTEDHIGLLRQVAALRAVPPRAAFSVANIGRDNLLS